MADLLLGVDLEKDRDLRLLHSHSKHCGIFVNNVIFFAGFKIKKRNR